MNRDQLKIELTRDEGLRLKPYVDTVGKTTIGVGRNLTDVGVSNFEAGVMLENDIAKAEADLNRVFPWWITLSDARQRVLVNMTFNMGIGGLSGFKNMLAAAEVGNYDIAAYAMLESKWADQVGDRAERLAKMMREG